MSKVTPEKLEEGLSGVLKELNIKGYNTANKGVRAAGMNLFGRVIKETPVDTGRARGNWFITHGSASNKSGGVRLPENPIIKMRSFDLIKRRKWFLNNNLLDIYALEYGDYPNPPKQGTYVKGKGYEQRSQNGFSRQAPNGMVRKNIALWPSLLKRAFK